MLLSLRHFVTTLNQEHIVTFVKMISENLNSNVTLSLCHFVMPLVRFSAAMDNKKAEYLFTDTRLLKWKDKWSSTHKHGPNGR